MRTRLPPLESLRVFEACARRGNFTQAADELGVTPTAVSMRVRGLERALGCTLFARRGPRVTLTAPGRLLADRVGAALAMLRDGVDACHGARAPLRLSVTPTFALRWLLPRLPLYERLDPATTIKLDVSTDVRTNGAFDLAIRSGRGGWPGVRSEELMPILRTPMCSPRFLERHGIAAPADLLRVPLVRETCWRAWFDLAGVDGAPAEVVDVEYETQDMAAAAIVAGAGVALLSPILFGDLVATGALVRPFDVVLDDGDRYYLVRHRREERPEVQHFATWLLGQIAEEHD